MNTALTKLRCTTLGHKWIPRSQPNHVVLPACRRCGKVDEVERIHVPGAVI